MEIEPQNSEHGPQLSFSYGQGVHKKMNKPKLFLLMIQDQRFLDEVQEVFHNFIITLKLNQ